MYKGFHAPPPEHPAAATGFSLIWAGASAFEQGKRGRVLEPLYIEARYLDAMRCRPARPKPRRSPGSSIPPYVTAPDIISLNGKPECVEAGSARG